MFIDALYEAFTRKEEPSDLSIALLTGEAVPLSRLMGDQIEALRKWAKGRGQVGNEIKVREQY